MLRRTLIFLFLLLAGPLRAHVDEVRVEKRELVLGGQPFGEAGAYEMLSGTIRFSFDPDSSYDARIVDLDKAPCNAQGRVEASANFVALQAVNPDNRAGLALLEVSNRGGKAALRYFQKATAELDPNAPASFGDGLLMREGITLLWVGWQFDVPPGGDRLRLEAPVARNADGSAITGLVRSDWVVDEPAAVLELGHRGHLAYPVLDPGDPANVLTMREGREAARKTVPREEWRFLAGGTSIEREGGFEVGRIYELVYRAKDPAVVGLGLAAIRDAASCLRYDEDCPFAAQQVVAVGISQTGRFLRHFLYQGFNTDEEGRMAVDGMLILTAGAGRGSFNHRFAQPSRDAHAWSAFFYPTDLFPFTGATQKDPVAGREDGLFAHLHDPAHLPKIFFVNTGYEYWGRAAALIHVTPDGASDVEPGPRERIYHLSGAQHFPGPFPPRPMPPAQPDQPLWSNPMQFKPAYRALLMRLIKWVSDDVPPPNSVFPHLSDGKLVPFSEWELPGIPGVLPPAGPHVAYRADYGAEWEQGVITHQPPQLGPAFPALVPTVNQMGNETGGIAGVELEAPLGTYLPWSTRAGRAGAPEAIADFVGAFVPYPRTREEKQERGDPRRPLSRIYALDGDLAAARRNYANRVRQSAGQLVRKGFLLQEDVAEVEERSLALWDWVMAR